jgi:hypothetical protein
MNMQITYAELKEFLDTLTPEQLALPARVYAGDVDDVMDIFSTCENTEEIMGESIEGYATNQIFLQI